MKLLEGRVALVTGGARGIGAATVAALRAEGAEICVVDLDEDQGEGAAAAGSREPLVIRGDLANPDLPARAVRTTLEHFGQLDILVNNAGYFWDAPLHRMTDDQFMAMLDIHVMAPFRLMRALIEHWRPLAKSERESGLQRHRKIVNVTSRAALVGLPGAANYAAGKAALIGLTRSAARENAALCINVNAVAFGPVATRFGEPAGGGAVIRTGGREVRIGIGGGPTGAGGPAGPVAARRFRTMLGRAATPAEAAHSVLYLCSPLSDLLNGEVIQANG